MHYTGIGINDVNILNESPCIQHIYATATGILLSLLLYTLTRLSADVGRRHLDLGCCFLPPSSTAAATVFLDTEGVTGLGRIGIPDRAALGLCGPTAVTDDNEDDDDDDLRPVAMSLANTMAAATGAPDG